MKAVVSGAMQRGTFGLLNNYPKKLAILAAFAGFTVLRFFISFRYARDSDDANNFLAGFEMGRGNWNLSGWTLAPDSFYTTDVLGIAVLTRLLGFHPLLMQLLEAILWALVVMVAIRLAGFGRSLRQTCIAALVVTTTLALTVQTGNPVMQYPTKVASHAFPILLALLTFWRVSDLYENRVRLCASTLAALALIVVMGSVADPTYVVIACLPVLATGFMRLSRHSDNRAGIAVMVTTLGGVIFSHIFLHLIRLSSGFERTALEISFANFDGIMAHLQFAIHAMAQNLGADFSGRPVIKNLLAGPFITVLRFPFLLLLFAAVIGAGWACLPQWRRWPTVREGESRITLLDQLLLFSVVLGATAAIVTTAIVNETCVRYFLPAMVAGVILLTRFHAGTPLFTLYALLAFSGSIVAEVQELREAPHRPVMSWPGALSLADTLRAHGLEHGYGGYWQSSIVTVLTRRDAQVLALREDQPGHVLAMRWFTNLHWYQRAAAQWRGKVFVIARASGADALDLPQETVLRYFGKPLEIIKADVFLIDVYDNSNGALKLPGA